MLININAIVKVRMTEAGMEILNRSNVDARIFVSDGNVIRTELWVIMRVFGQEMRNGGLAFFSGNIIEIDSGEIERYNPGFMVLEKGD